MKTIIFDIDNTICTEEKIGEKYLAKQFENIVELINKLYYSGNIIILYTSRNWCDYKITKKWLKENNVNHSELMCGKPIYDMWIDDKSFNPKNIEEIINYLEDKNG